MNREIRFAPDNEHMVDAQQKFRSDPSFRSLDRLMATTNRRPAKIP